MSIYGTEQALLRVIASAGPTTSRLDDQSARQAHQEIQALNGRVGELEEKMVMAAKLFMATPSEAGTKILQQMEMEKADLVRQLEAARDSRLLIDHRADWKEVKARLESSIKCAGQLPLEVIPVSVKMVNGKMEFLRHVAAQSENDVIALREALRSHIERIGIDVPKMKATIHFKTGDKLPVEFRKSNSYPRTYAYRVRDGDWVDLGKDPSR